MALHQPMHWLGGFIADLPTPFDDDDRVDWPAFETLCEHQIRSGATAIVVGETMGEDWIFGRDEHKEIVPAAVDITRGRVAVIAGAGSNATSQATELTTTAEAAGADAILSVVPYYNRPLQAVILAHFQAIAGVTGLPVILHDVPSRTMREISDETIVRLAESRQFIGLKDATGSVARLTRLKPALPPTFRFLSGDDATATAYLASGGDGCISISCQLFSGTLPEHLRRLQDGSHAGPGRIVGPHYCVSDRAFGRFAGRRPQVRPEPVEVVEARGTVAACRTRR